MNISSAIFDCSAPHLGVCPDESLPEFAFIGRSNVGKSSLLNLLTGRQDLARVSATPGHTKTINFYTINGKWRLVDLPGYGFAEGARKNRGRFSQAVAHYLRNRPNLRGVFALIDSRHPPQEIDLEFLEWISSVAVPVVLVFTKCDKASATRVRENIAAFKAQLSPDGENLPEIFTSSARERIGRADLLGVIEQVLIAQPTPGEEAPGRETAAVPASVPPAPRPPLPVGHAPWLRPVPKSKARGSR